MIPLTQLGYQGTQSDLSAMLGVDDEVFLNASDKLCSVKKKCFFVRDVELNQSTSRFLKNR